MLCGMRMRRLRTTASINLDLLPLSQGIVWRRILELFCGHGRARSEDLYFIKSSKMLLRGSIPNKGSGDSMRPWITIVFLIFSCAAPSQPNSTLSSFVCTAGSFAKGVHDRAIQTRNGEPQTDFVVSAACKTSPTTMVRVKMHCGDSIRQQMALDLEPLRKIGRPMKGVGIEAIAIDRRVVAWDDNSNCKIDLEASSRPEAEEFAKEVVLNIP